MKSIRRLHSICHRQQWLAKTALTDIRDVRSFRPLVPRGSPEMVGIAHDRKPPEDFESRIEWTK